MSARFWVGAALVAALAACGGGAGGTSGGSVGPPTTSQPATGTVQFIIGQNQAVQVRRKTEYLSSHTASVVVSVNGHSYAVDFIQGTSACSGAIPNLVCTLTIDAPVGSDQFIISAYDAYAGGGNLLSTAYVTATISTGTNTVHAVLDGVAEYADVQRAINLPEGIATAVPFAVTVYDADREAIVAPGNYTTPIPLADSDTGGGTSLLTPLIAGPSVQPKVSYNGISAVAGYVTAWIGNRSTQGSGTGLLRIVPQYSEYAMPSGRRAIAIAAAGDGSVWVAEGGSPAPAVTIAFAHVLANGSITEYPQSSALGTGVTSMTFGSDGALWCSTGPTQGASTGAILRVDASGNVTSYTNPALTNPGKIALGPDGKIWFTQRSSVGNVDTSGTFTFYPAGTTPTGDPMQLLDIAAGPDGNLWAAEMDQGGLLKITTAGMMMYYPMPLIPNSPYNQKPTSIATQGGKLYVPATNTLYVMDTSGSVLSTVSLTNFPNADIVPASNGSVWVPVGWDVAGGSVIDRITAGGSLSAVSVPYKNDPGIGTDEISQIVTAKDGSMWYVRGTSAGRIEVR